MIAYLKSAQELLRALLATHRKALTFRSAKEWARRAVELYAESSRYGTDYARTSAQKALDDAKEKTRELKESVTEVTAVTKKFLETRAKTSAVLPTDVLADLSIIERFAKGLEERFPKTLEDGTRSGTKNPSD